MTKTIWKFPFKVEGTVILEMPKGAQILHIEVQHNQPCVWALVDEDAPTERRAFWIWGTGHPIEHSNELKHIGTFTDGGFVWHAFEKKEIPVSKWRDLL